MIIFNKNRLYKDSSITPSSSTAQHTSRRVSSVKRKLYNTNKNLIYQTSKHQRNALNKTNQKFLQSLGFKLKTLK